MHAWLTWANVLTFIRVVILAPTVWCILHEAWLGAALAFTVAVITDIYDGKLARRLGQTSPFGGLFDHATDAVFVALCCWALAQLQLSNPILPWLIALAFTQYMLDSKALQGVALRMSAVGRSNGVAYYVLVGFGIGSQIVGLAWLQQATFWFSWVLVVSSLVSMMDRAVSLLRKPRA